MNPEELNTRITIEEYKNVPDDDGFESKEWVEFKKLWAKKTGLSGRVFYAAAAVQSESDVVFKIRYTKEITASMRIVEGENIYDIKADPVDRDGKRKELYITASKVRAN
ncbi:phage head closure protein [Clostridium felsineum]|uniref:phage head closure protein n=1 Tax=Clostridium felsineum TaxID=36839 RepID=UPI00214D58C1|nr:phage head closure protein [Clostridium felsineum]MCR3758158.1 phage head closure protein [Clostridium felsineum]